MFDTTQGQLYYGNRISASPPTPGSPSEAVLLNLLNAVTP